MAAQQRHAVGIPVHLQERGRRCAGEACKAPRACRYWHNHAPAPVAHVVGLPVERERDKGGAGVLVVRQAQQLAVFLRLDQPLAARQAMVEAVQPQARRHAGVAVEELRAQGVMAGLDSAPAVCMRLKLSD